MSTEALVDTLTGLLTRRCSPDTWAWLEKALEAARPPVHANTLLGYHAGASRRVGKQVLNLDPDELVRAEALAPGIFWNEWAMDEAARALLLLSLAHLPEDEYYELTLQCYELGDSREQEGWLRGLSLLPKCERYLSTAVDACRTNIIPLFESIACENPYPEVYFPELNFNQMVLKSLFSGIPLRRISGIESRLNPTLSRMADDYVSEREAAGRSVPEDIWLVLAPYIAAERPESLERVVAYLDHENPGHRYWAAVGLGLAGAGGSGGEAGRKALAARQQSETDPTVRTAVDDALSRVP